MRLGVILGGCALLLAACGDGLPFAPAGPDAAPSPEQMGPYPVGVRTYELSDRTRMDETGQPRQLTVEVWYPAEASARDAPSVTYFLADLLPESVREKLGGKNVGEVPTPAVRDAGADRDGAPYPVVLFSHGNGGVRMQSTFFTVALASHGYVVLAPDHAGNTLADFLESDEVDVGAIFQSAFDRPKDLGFLVDWLRRLEAPEPLAGIADTTKVAATGHSFGASTALRFAGLDERVDVVVAQAPAGHGITWLDIERPLEDLSIPIMLQVGGLDQTMPPDVHAESLWMHSTRPRYLVNLIRGGHFTFSDLCAMDLELLAEADVASVARLLEDGCDTDNVPPEISHPLVRRFGIGLINAALRDSPESAAYLEPSGEEVELRAEP